MTTGSDQAQKSYLSNCEHWLFLSSPNPTETIPELGKHKPTEWKIEGNLQKAQELVASGTYGSRD